MGACQAYAVSYRNVGWAKTTSHSSKFRNACKPTEISGVCPCWIEMDVGKRSDACWFVVLQRRTILVAVMAGSITGPVVKRCTTVLCWCLARQVLRDHPGMVFG